MGWAEFRRQAGYGWSGEAPRDSIRPGFVDFLLTFSESVTLSYGEDSWSLAFCNVTLCGFTDAADAASKGEYQQAGTALIFAVVKPARAAKAGAAAIDANKLAHIFGNARHNLGPLVQKIGSQEATFTAVQSATQAAVRSQGLSSVFETTVTVAGQNVVVRGNVIDGVARIGTFFIP